MSNQQLKTKGLAATVLFFLSHSCEDLWQNENGFITGIPAFPDALLRCGMMFCISFLYQIQTAEEFTAGESETGV